MTKEIIEMAVQAGMAKEIAEVNIEIVEAFYNLVAAKERENWPAEMKAMENQVNILTDELSNAVKAEREACAKMFEDKPTLLFWGLEAARHIRARKETV